MCPVCIAWVFVLVTLGAFTTSIGAGMAFPDWPLSNGSINPEGWLTDVSKFAEHSHRLTGMMMGLITIGIALWLWRREERGWLRLLGLWSLGIVILQGVIGGQRVTLNAIAVPGFHMSLGEMLRIPHGILAQVYVCVLIAIYVFILPAAGFLAATTLLMIALYAIGDSRGFGLRPIIAGAITAAAAYGLFVWLLDVPLPGGWIWGN